MPSLTLIRARQYVAPGVRMSDTPQTRTYLFSIPAVRSWLAKTSGVTVMFVAGDDDPVAESPEKDMLTVPVSAEAATVYAQEAALARAQ